MNKQQDLSIGFQKADNAEIDYLVKFLEDAHRVPSAQECFREQLQWLNIKPGQHILDIGCGIGDQALELAKLTGATGKVVGTDISQMMISISKERHQHSNLPLTFLAADATEQPFPDESFDIIRIERVLMYVPGLNKAFGEFKRLLKPGGKLLIFDFDWDALSIGHTNKALTRKIVSFISDACFPNGRIATLLPEYLSDFGFKLVRMKGAAYFPDLPFAKKIIGGMVSTGVEKGIFNEEEINEWWNYLDEQNRKHIFFASCNGFITMAVK